MRISGVIITYNEENNIERCLKSLEGIVDEIVVVDSFSTDRTKEICLSYNVKFSVNKFEGHIQQKNHAMSLASNNMILSLDADEALSEELRKSILQLKLNSHSDEKAFSFNRLTSYCGQWIYHCGWYPDKKIRLWNRTIGKWGGVNPHDKVEIADNANSKHVKGDILHYSFESISSHVQTANNFSTIAAKAAFERGKKANLVLHIILNPIFTFVSKYFLKLGFLDGFNGFVICYLSAVSNFLKYSKLRQLNKSGQ